MNRVKQMAGALMLLVPLAACDEGTPPPPTGSIEGTVTIDGTGADGVTVTLNDGTTTTTAGGGAYRFAGVEGGAYTVAISGYPSDANFDATQASATIASANQVVRVNFSGSYIRTSSILGSVMVEGVGQSGLSVALSGMSEGTTTTANDGAFSFTGLRAGTYTVEVSGIDSDTYHFSSTRQSATVAVGGSAELNFAGTHVRTASIRGTVTVGDAGLPGVQVSLTGLSEATRTTDDAGSYEFEGLQAGEYTVAISGFNAREYGFEITTRTASLDVGEAANLNFEGTALRNGGITGRIYIDETTKNDEFDAKEELKVAGVMVILTGPGVAQVDTTATDAEGMYGFDSLEAGSYRVAVAHAAAMADTAVKLPSYLAYGGRTDGYVVRNLGASGMEEVNFPFDIVTQKVKVRATYGADTANVGGPVVGVTIDLHATTAAAQAGGRGSLGQQKTDSMGYATFEFARKDDTGPGEGLVYARATPLANTTLSGRNEVAIEYASTNPDAMAREMFMLLSTRAVLEFAVVNRSNDGNSGGDAMAGWKVHVRKDSAKAAATDTLTSAAKTGMVAKTYSGVERGDKYYIRIPGGTAEVPDSVESQDTSLTKGESFKAMATAGDDGTVTSVGLDAASAKTDATQFLVYTHTGLEPPTTKMDVGTLHVTFTTQTLVVGVHHERDNIDGFTDITPGDVRPTGTDLGSNDITVQLFEPDPIRGYPTPLTDEDGEDMPAKAVAINTGLAMWTGLDSDTDLIVEANIRGNKKALSTTRLNVFGTDVDTEKHGTTGAFGDAGGLMPRVLFCPQTITNGPMYMKDCSTFAYKFTDNTISLHARAVYYNNGADTVLVGGAVVTVKALPRQPGTTSPRASKNTVAATGNVSFTDLTDGEYEVKIAGDTAGNWKLAATTSGTDTVSVLGGAEGSSDELPHKIMAYQKTTIQGTVVRDGWTGYTDRGHGQDVAANDVVDHDETRSGLVVQLVRGARNAVVATATTDRDGEYEFEDVPEGTYKVRGPKGDDYVLCHRTVSGTLSALKGSCNNPVTTAVTTDATEAGKVHERDTTLPGWSPYDWTIDDPGDDTDFVVLFSSSTASGNVEKIFTNAQSVLDTAPYVGVEVRAYRCDTVVPGNAVGSRCTSLESSIANATAETDDDGNWEIDGLLEGIYRIELDIPSGETAAPVRYETANSAGDNSGGGRPFIGEDGRRRNLDFTVTIN